MPGIQSASTTPVSRSRRAPPAIGTRAKVRRPNARSMFCGPNSTAMSPGGRSTESARPQPVRARPGSRAGRGTRRTAALPARAVDEAPAIRREARRRHDALAERHRSVLDHGRLAPHRRHGDGGYGGHQGRADQASEESAAHRRGPQARSRQIGLGDPAQLGRQVARGLPPIVGTLGEAATDQPLSGAGTWGLHGRSAPAAPQRQ